jgi:hypothetical protein
VIGGSEIDLVSSKILPAATSSTCVSTPCAAYGVFATNAKLHLRTSRVEGTKSEGAAGTTAVESEDSAIFGASGAAIDVASSFLRGRDTAVIGQAGATIDVKASTLNGGAALWNYASAVNVASSVLATSLDGASALVSVACPGVAKTSLEASFVVLPSPVAFAVLFEPDGTGTCAVKSSPSSPDATVAAATASNQFAITSTARSSACAASASDCLLTVFATTDDAKLKDGVTCAIAKGGMAFPEITTDLFGAMRTAPTSMGAHEYDGTCSNQ